MSSSSKNKICRRPKYIGMRNLTFVINLWIKAKKTKPKEILRNHALLTSNVELIWALEENKKGTIVQYETMMKRSKENILQLD